jgi:hypothetical protein
MVRQSFSTAFSVKTPAMPFSSLSGVVPPPPSFSPLSRPELEALLVKLLDEITAPKQMNSELTD